jgi:hypothetical protein
MEGAIFFKNNTNFLLAVKRDAPLFFSQKKSGRKEKGRKTTYQNKSSASELKFPKNLERKSCGKFLNARKPRFVVWYFVDAGVFF